ncbi:MAG: class I SAM-dependent methyltransferase, partial [Gammaproteobacteria bacterium]|nr:class I SAM-dependent methyltransferase [Gammaproteobacteria bacterium]
DHSAQMLVQAAQRNARSMTDGVTSLTLGNVDRLPPYGAVFDKVLSANVIQFLPDKLAVFREVFNVMRAGGRVATTYQPRSAHRNRSAALKMADAITCAMQAAGFVAICTHELDLKPVPAICVIGMKAPEAEVTATPTVKGTHHE